jgi:hypothetical protein
MYLDSIEKLLYSKAGPEAETEENEVQATENDRFS